ncbi:MAG: hypothetical protein FJ189_10810 [Gammaproteobacteria bacterium]|nr:hypothetical protein [Gammaproteobacteria bacterium]
MQDKRQAYEFLESVKLRLEDALPRPAEMRRRVRRTCAQARKNPALRHMRGAEHAFVNGEAVPVLFRLLAEHPGMSEESARLSFLSESFRSLPDFCSGTPTRALRHPFSKALGADPGSIYRKWSGRADGRELTKSCPDFAWRHPFPHRIVFEAKYFERGGLSTAERSLVVNAYQACFYRGLPAHASVSERPVWDYDYACVFAYDAGDRGYLVQAWETLPPEVKNGFWNGANLYMMILRGHA